MRSRLAATLAAFAVVAVSLLAVGAASPAHATPGRAADAVPGCPGGGPDGPNCLQAPTNGTAVSPAPSINYVFSTRYHETMNTGTFTATFTPPYKECPNPGAIAYGDIPCMESRTLAVDARLYIPGAPATSTSVGHGVGVGAGPVTGGHCDLNSCDEQMVLAAPYIGPGTVLLHYSELAIVNGGAFEDHSFDIAVNAPTTPILGLSHTVRPQVAFRGTVSGSKRVTLKVPGVPSSAAGLYAVVQTVTPATKYAAKNSISMTEIVKGRVLKLEVDGRATATVTVTGWVDAKPSVSGALLHKVTQESVRGTSVRVAHVPSDATAVLMSVSSGSDRTSKIGGIAVNGDPVGVVVPLSHGKLSLSLAKGTTAYVQGYFNPVALTNDGQPQFITETDEGSDFFQLPEL